MAIVSKSISIQNEEFSEDTSPSFARKYLYEVKSTIVTLQRVVKQKMTLDIHNWSSIAHQELHKIVKDEIFPIVIQVDARVQNFKIQFLKEAAKFVRDFKSLAKEADESLAKHKVLEYEIERLLRAVIERLQAQLGDLKGKSKDTPCESDTIDPLPQKLENENVELEFQVSKQKDTTKGTSVNTKFVNQSTVGKPLLQPLRNHYVVRQPNAFQSERPKFSKTQVPPKVVQTNGLSNPVTLNSVPTTKESQVMNNDKVHECYD
ncbi:hypothetical protein Tco_1424167 [Tanacetum coccineum]